MRGCSALVGHIVPEFDKQRLSQLPAAAIHHVLQDKRVHLLNIGMRLPEEIDFGQTKVAAFLRTQGADVSIANNDGNTALHLASFFAYPDLVELLLKHGAPSIKNAHLCISTVKRRPASQNRMYQTGGITIRRHTCVCDATNAQLSIMAVGVSHRCAGKPSRTGEHSAARPVGSCSPAEQAGPAGVSQKPGRLTTFRDLEF